MNPENKDKPGVEIGLLQLFGLTFLICAGAYVGLLFFQGFQIRRSETRLQSQKDYAPIAGACAELIKRLGTNKSQYFDGKDSALPAVIQQFKPSYVYAHTNQVKIICGGAYHHWGLFYGDITAPSEGAILEFWSDGHQSKRLWP